MLSDVPEPGGPTYASLGAVEGKLRAVKSPGRVSFGLDDSIWGCRLTCEVPEALETQALYALAKRVLVTGVVSTDAAGRPRHVMVETIRELPEREQLPQTLKGIDPDYTDGLDVSEYVKRRWTGDA